MSAHRTRGWVITAPIELKILQSIRRDDIATLHRTGCADITGLTPTARRWGLMRPLVLPEKLAGDHVASVSDVIHSDWHVRHGIVSGWCLLAGLDVQSNLVQSGVANVWEIEADFCWCGLPFNCDFKKSLVVDFES